MASLYLHVPFCERKCIYCDFYSIENLKPLQTFVEAIVAEIEMYRDFGRRETIETIFFGGGTPSLLNRDELTAIFTALHSVFTINETAEITLEANPGTVSAQKLKDYRAIGINRLSYGVQSFLKHELEFLGRIHSAEQAIQSVRHAHEAGFENINIDLIFSLPGQTKEQWSATLDQAVSLHTKHISAYSLIIEPNTPLQRMVANKQIAPSPAEHEAEMYEYTMQYFREHGFEHYEVSNYARKGYHSRHNSNYWNHTNYLSFGPSAHSFWEKKRWWNVKNLQLYFDRIASGVLPVEAEETLTHNELFEETIMLGLRSSGIDLSKMQSIFGIDLLEQHSMTIHSLLTEGLAVHEGNLLRLTDKGFMLCDSIAQSLLIELPETIAC